MEKLIPQPPLKYFIGNANEIDGERLLESTERLQRIYGPIFRLTVLGDNIVVVSSQELTNAVCDESKFDKAVGGALKELRPVAGDGLFTAHSSEPNWTLAHRILMPAFGPQAVRGMFSEMFDIASQLIFRWQRFSGEDIDVCDNLTRLTLDTIALCSFNYRFNSFYQTKMHSFVDAMINVLLESGRRFTRLSIQNALMFGTNRRYYNDIDHIHKLCDEIVRERREHPNEINDLLNRMIKGKDVETGYQLSDENIRFQMVTFLVAGHETTSGLLSFTVYYLLKNPHCLQKAQAEVDQYDDITIDTLNKLKYLDAVLKETLRLQPTAPFFGLHCKDDQTFLPGGYKVHQNETILVLLSQLHRDPKVWNQPEEFLPERMIDGGFERLPPNAWKPFGNGQRACIGRPFAWQESLLTMALILKHFHMEFVDPSYDLRVKQTLTIKPDGLKIRVRSRKPFQISIDQNRILTSENHSNLSQSKPIEMKTTTKKENLHPMLILFGSNSGSCESFARTLGFEGILHGYDADVATLDSSVESLPTDRPVIILTASYEGQPCDNAKQFISYLERQPQLNISFAVFGAGHHDWVNSYQKIPKYIDEMLEKLGGQRLVERGEGDAAGDFYGSFESWKEKLFQTIGKTSSEDHSNVQERLSIDIVHVDRQLEQMHEVGIVLENRSLVDFNQFESSVRHLEIQLPKGQTYRSGDYLAVLPSNPVEVISRILRQFHLSTNTFIRIHSSTKTFLPVDRPMSVFDILSGYVELSQPISKKQVEILSEHCQDENEKMKLNQLLINENYDEEILVKRLSILDLLESNRSCQITFVDYLRMLPPLRIRQYSISSSPLWNPDVVTLTIDVLQSPSLTGSGKYFGVASNYLSNLKRGDQIVCSVRTSNVRFHPPSDPQIPLVMIATGTGIAPFRAFIQERAAQSASGRPIGRSRLYFGCRSEDFYLYKNDLDKWKKFDAVEVKVAFSRQANVKKTYVQDLLWENRDEITNFYRNGAKFYTCGSARKIGQSVKETFIRILTEIHQCDSIKAKEILEDISLDRFCFDVFV